MEVHRAAASREGRRGVTEGRRGQPRRVHPLPRLPEVVYGAVPSPIRCPRCGTEFWAAHPAHHPGVAWSTCPRCWSPVPSFLTHDSPPLFSWEVQRHLYPEPAWPTRPTPRTLLFIVGLLLGAGLLLVAVAGGLAWVGVASLDYPNQTIAGVVLGGTPGGPFNPVVDAQVSLSGIEGVNVTTTNTAGTFSFTGVSAGEHLLRVLAAGYPTTALDTFLSPFYNAPAGNVTHLVVDLPTSTGTGGRLITYTDFPDLETYVATLLASTVIVGVAGVLAIAGSLILWKKGSAPKPVVGASATVIVPLLAIVSGFGDLLLAIFPLSIVIMSLASLLGVTGLLVLLRTYRPLDGRFSPPDRR